MLHFVIRAFAKSQTPSQFTVKMTFSRSPRWQRKEIRENLRCCKGAGRKIIIRLSKNFVGEVHEPPAQFKNFVFQLIFGEYATFM